ncbi:hypothetical protein [Promicromonospora sp. NPDC059942]|uniref:hypothetical protein n=1 Tax=Promicromonospora sp. NPDC059942 TaxID=3347009 RepID=UPI0036591F47
MGDAQRRSPWTVQQRQLGQVDYAARTVRNLVPHLANPDLDGVLYNACLESFFINVRSLAEFLQKRGNKDKDIWIADILPTWECEPGELGVRLRYWWDLASQQVAHFGLPRTEPTDEPITLQTYEQMRDDVLTVYRRFRKELAEFLNELPVDDERSRMRTGSAFDPPKGDGYRL